VFAMGGALPPIQVGLVAALGMTLGEMTGYLAGYGGGVVIENRRRYEQIRGYMQRYGLATIIVLAIIPNPFFDVAGVVAGALKMPVWKFMLACFVGKAIKAIAFAYAGAGSAPFIANFFHRRF
jgi:membrane protein YqaA with SNARE-associated domain